MVCRRLPLHRNQPSCPTQGKYEEADLLHKRALQIEEKGFGSNHPAVAVTLNNRAYFLEKQVNDGAKCLLCSRYCYS